MKKNRLFYLGVFVTIIIALNLYYIWDSERIFFETRQYEYQLVSAVLSTNEQVDRKLKEIEYIISNFEDREKLELIGENLELQWQNEKLVRELLNMFNLLRGREMPVYKPLGKVKI